MKKYLIQTLIAVFIASAGFANADVSVSQHVKRSFEREFQGAQGVNWERLGSNSIYHASFILNSERLNAYFSAEGELIATGRYIKSEGLPLLVSKSIATNYPNQNIEEVIEYVTGNETSYIVKVAGARSIKYVRAYIDGNLTVLKKEKKK